LLTGGSAAIERLLRRSVHGFNRCWAIFSRLRSGSPRKKQRRLAHVSTLHNSLPSIMQPLACHTDEGGICELNKRKRLKTVSLLTTIVYRTTHRSIVPRDDKQPPYFATNRLIKISMVLQAMAVHR
jgi:hypothetical protein